MSKKFKSFLLGVICVSLVFALSQAYAMNENTYLQGNYNTGDTGSDNSMGNGNQMLTGQGLQVKGNGSICISQVSIWIKAKQGTPWSDLGICFNSGITSTTDYTLDNTSCIANSRATRPASNISAFPGWYNFSFNDCVMVTASDWVGFYINETTNDNITNFYSITMTGAGGTTEGNDFYANTGYAYGTVGGDGYDLQYMIYNSTPPIPALKNSSWNVTSGNVMQTLTATTAWNSGAAVAISSNLLSLTVTASIESNMSCRLDTSQTYAQMVAANESYKAATTKTTAHSLTLADNIDEGKHCVYCAFIDTTYMQAAQSGCLNISYDKPPLCDISYPSDSQQIYNLINVTWSSSDGYDPFMQNLSIYNSSWGTTIGYPLTKNIHNFLYNFSNISNGNYTLKLSVLENESLEKLGCNDTISVEITDVPVPVITVSLDSPANNSELTTAIQNFGFNVSNSSSCQLFINASNKANLSAALGLNFFTGVTVTNGSYSWNVYCSEPGKVAGNTSLWYFTAGIEGKAQELLSMGKCPSDTWGWVLIFVMLAVGLILPILKPIRMGEGIMGGLIYFYSGMLVMPCFVPFGILIFGLGAFLAITDLS